MEFPELGVQCSVSTCKDLDFLPITCTYCSQIFCKNHYHVDAHSCSKTAESNNFPSGHQSFPCTVDGCDTSTPVEMLCEKCSKHYCLSHRHHGCFDKSEEELQKEKLKWSESQAQFSKSNAEVQKQVTGKLIKAQLKPKSSIIAQKLQLMKLKGKAVGEQNIIINERLYFLIFLPLSLKSPSKAVYVSREWTVGRVIDSTASLCKVINKNNDMLADKLRLFKKNTGYQIHSDLSVKLNDLFSNDLLYDGESLILEYVNKDKDLTVFCLDNTDDYVE